MWFDFDLIDRRWNHIVETDRHTNTQTDTQRERQTERKKFLPKTKSGVCLIFCIWYCLFDVGWLIGSLASSFSVWSNSSGGSREILGTPPAASSRSKKPLVLQQYIPCVLRLWYDAAHHITLRRNCYLSATDGRAQLHRLVCHVAEVALQSGSPLQEETLKGSENTAVPAWFIARRYHTYTAHPIYWRRQFGVSVDVDTCIALVS